MPRDKADKDRDEEREARIQQLMERAQKELRSKRPEGQGTTKPKMQKAGKARNKKK